MQHVLSRLDHQAHTQAESGTHIHTASLIHHVLFIMRASDVDKYLSAGIAGHSCG